MPQKIFINSPLSSIAEQWLNNKIRDISISLGYEVYSPQEKIPPGSNASAIKIYNANIQAVKNCDIVLSVLDKPGLGVIFELAYAVSLQKTILMFRSDKQDYLGKVVEGLWESADKKSKAQTIDELKEILISLKDRNK